MFYEWTKSTRAHLLTADEGSNKVPLQCEWISREMTESQAPNSETASNNLVLSRGKWMWHARTLLEILWHFSQVLWFDFIYPSRKEPTTFCFNSSFALSWDFLSFFFCLLQKFSFIFILFSSAPCKAVFFKRCYNYSIFKWTSQSCCFWFSQADTVCNFLLVALQTLAYNPPYFLARLRQLDPPYFSDGWH